MFCRLFFACELATVPTYISGQTAKDAVPEDLILFDCEMSPYTEYHDHQNYYGYDTCTDHRIPMDFVCDACHENKKLHQAFVYKNFYDANKTRVKDGAVFNICSDCYISSKVSDVEFGAVFRIKEIENMGNYANLKLDKLSYIDIEAVKECLNVQKTITSMPSQLSSGLNSDIYTFSF